jgi:hypothetical protein
VLGGPRSRTPGADLEATQVDLAGDVGLGEAEPRLVARADRRVDERDRAPDPRVRERNRAVELAAPQVDAAVGPHAVELERPLAALGLDEARVVCHHAARDVGAHALHPAAEAPVGQEEPPADPRASEDQGGPLALVLHDRAAVTVDVPRDGDVAQVHPARTGEAGVQQEPAINPHAVGCDAGTRRATEVNGRYMSVDQHDVVEGAIAQDQRPVKRQPGQVQWAADAHANQPQSVRIAGRAGARRDQPSEERRTHRSVIGAVARRSLLPRRRP